MKKAILAATATIVLGVGGILLGQESALPIPELGPIIAIAVMGGFIIHFNEQGK